MKDNKGVLYMENPYFPKFLKDLNGGPKQLYYKGNLELLNKPCIAVVGSRKCTSYGKTVAKSIGKRLGECGVTVVSGLARGIDTHSHNGALEVGGSTIAVLGCGIDLCYPPENKTLRDKIVEKGLLLSEYPDGTEAKPYMFPMRNRIISGISESVVIVEAMNRSGALITAENAAEQGKKLYAVPGNITSHYSFGTNKLIRDNVTPLIIIDDLLLDLNIKPSINDVEYNKMGKDEMKVYNTIKNSGEISINHVHEQTGIPASTISGIVTVLEMKGLVFSAMGKVFVAKF